MSTENAETSTPVHADCYPDRVLVRSAVDDFWAMRIADAMQGCRGVEVISIVHSGQAPQSGSNSWHVFAKFASHIVSIDRIDAAIKEAYRSA